MANIKYRKSDGTYGVITNYNVQPLIPVQETGESVIDVMSQKAVTNELKVLEKQITDIDITGLASKEELQTEVNTLNQRIDKIGSTDLPDNIVTTVNGESGDVVLDFVKQEDLSNLQTNVETNTTNISNKQDKIDNSLTTEVKTIVGGINEVNNKIESLSSTTQQSIETINENVVTINNSIDEIKNSIPELPDNIVTSVNDMTGDVVLNFAKQEDLSNKQDKTDNSLVTTSKTVVGGINELKTSISSLAKQSDLSSLQTKVNTNTTNISNLTTKVNTNTTNISNKQDKTDNSLATTNKTIVGGINELKTSLDNLDTELDKKQDKSDNSLKTTTKTVVGGINELDSKLKAEEFAGGLKVKLANNGTAIITNEGIRVLDSNNVEKIKLIDGDIDIDDAKKHTTTTVSPVADSTLTLPSDSNITTTYKDSKSINVSGNVSKIKLSMYKDVTITCRVISTSTVARSEDYEYIVNIGDYAVRTYEINISIPANSNTATIKHRLKGETTWSTGGGFDITCSDFISYNNFRQVSNYFNVVLKKVTPNTSTICTIKVEIASHGGDRYCNVSIYNMTNGMDKTLIGFNGFLTFHDFNTYFTAYTDANNQYRIIGRGDVVDIKKNS